MSNFLYIYVSSLFVKVLYFNGGGVSVAAYLIIKCLNVFFFYAHSPRVVNVIVFCYRKRKFQVIFLR